MTFIEHIKNYFKSNKKVISGIIVTEIARDLLNYKLELDLEKEDISPKENKELLATLAGLSATKVLSKTFLNEYKSSMKEFSYNMAKIPVYNRNLNTAEAIVQDEAKNKSDNFFFNTAGQITEKKDFLRLQQGYISNVSATYIAFAANITSFLIKKFHKKRKKFNSIADISAELAKDAAKFVGYKILMTPVAIGQTFLLNKLLGKILELESDKMSYKYFLDKCNNSPLSRAIINDDKLINCKKQSLFNKIQSNNVRTEILLAILNTSFIAVQSPETISTLIKEIIANKANPTKTTKTKFWTSIANLFFSSNLPFFNNSSGDKEVISSLNAFNFTSIFYVTSFSELFQGKMSLNKKDEIKLSSPSFLNRMKIEKYINLKKGNGINDITGPNGAGKSTLASILTGNLNTTGGYIFTPNYFNKITNPISIVNAKKCEIPGITVKELLSEVDMDKVKEIWGKIGLKSFDSIIDREISSEQLSSGQKSALLTIKAMLQNSEMIILDESLSFLAKDVAIKLLNLIKQYEKKGNKIFYPSRQNEPSQPKFVINIQHVSEKIKTSKVFTL